MIPCSNEQLQQQLEYTLLKPDCHSWWISKIQSDTLEERYAIKFCFKLGKNAMRWKLDLLLWPRYQETELLYFDLWPGQKCHSKVMHQKEVTHSNGSYERKSHGRKLADEMGRGKKFPWYTHRLTHRKRVTCELHDSYFRWMTIKHAISKIKLAIEWALNYYITQSRQKLQFEFQLQLEESRCGRGTHTRPKGLGALMSWGLEKMLIRCSKESHHPAEWASGPPVEHQENKKYTTWWP